MNKKINLTIGTALAGVALVGSFVATEVQQKQVTLDNPQKVVWQKPTTDEEWAEDVKKENFDIKKTVTLEEMVRAHKEKLTREEKELDELLAWKEVGVNPEDALYLEYLKTLRLTIPSEKELHAEAQLLAQKKLSDMIFSVEKLKQSIERMEKELQLRERGFLIVREAEGESFGSLQGENNIRYVRD